MTHDMASPFGCESCMKYLSENHTCGLQRPGNDGVRRMLGTGAMALVCGLLVAAMRTPAVGIIIDIDYSRDIPDPFFDTTVKRRALEAAARVFERKLGDRLAEIAPGPFDTWTAALVDPNTGGNGLITDLHVPRNTIKVFVGGRDIEDADAIDGEHVLGLSGTGGIASVDGSPSFLDAVATRGQANASGPGATDYGRWGGMMSFDTMLQGEPVDWHFDLDSEPADGQPDLFSGALWGFAAVLGFGLSESWYTWVDPDDRRFTGPASTDVYGGYVPLHRSLTDWQNGIMSFVDGMPQEALLTRRSPPGARKYVTDLDWAGLQDIGWEFSIAGDMDFDRDVDFDDIGAFVLGINAPEMYKSMFGLPPTANGDTDQDGDFDFDDVPGFIATLGGGLSTSATRVAEPSSLALAIVIVVGIVGGLRFRCVRHGDDTTGFR